MGIGIGIEVVMNLEGIKESAGGPYQCNSIDVQFNQNKCDSINLEFKLELALALKLDRVEEVSKTLGGSSIDVKFHQNECNLMSFFLELKH